MSLYGQYIKELKDEEIVESEIGFATFKITGSECYIIDIYVIPEHRKSGESAKMSDQIESIAKDRGCKYLTGAVSPAANGSTISMKAMLACGFQFLRSEKHAVYFVKEIK